MNNEKLFGLLIVSALASSTFALAADKTAPADSKNKTGAYCQNASCAGNSACHGHGNDKAAGKNTCSGMGFLKASNAKECANLKGKWITDKS